MVERTVDGMVVVFRARWVGCRSLPCRRVRRCWRLSAAVRRRALRHISTESTSSRSSRSFYRAVASSVAVARLL